MVVADGLRTGRSATVRRAVETLVASTGLPSHRIGGGAGAGAAATPQRQARPVGGRLDRRPAHDDGSHAAAGCSTTALVGVYAELLARPDATEDSTFVDLGGDSLSYVELSLHLEERLGALPADWPLRPIRSLATDEPPRRRRMARVDTTIVLRALAILAIVGSHTHVVHVLGGAHILLGVAGYNFSRFAATAPSVRETWRRVGGTVARIAVPSVVWVAAVGLLAGTYSVANLGMVNWLFGSDTWSSTWRLWFLEALAWTLVAFAALLSVPPVRRLYARHPFGLAASVAALGRAGPARRLRPDLTPGARHGTGGALAGRDRVGRPGGVDPPPATRAERDRRRPRCPASWVTRCARRPSPRACCSSCGCAPCRCRESWCRCMAVLASASLYIYLTHFEVYRATDLPLVNLGLGLGVGLAAWAVSTRLSARFGVRRLRHARRH